MYKVVISPHLVLLELRNTEFSHSAASYNDSFILPYNYIGRKLI
jgi:hypothetical protein